MRIDTRTAVAASLLAALSTTRTQAQVLASPSCSILIPARPGTPPTAQGAPATRMPATAAPTPHASRPRERETVQVADRSLRATSLSVRDTALASQTQPDPAPEPEPEPVPSADPYGFAAILNNYRASAGLPPVSYDENLSHWASQNNAAQARRGLGHHVNPNCFQNCAWNSPDVSSAAASWMNSPGHRRNMLAPNLTRFGIAYGPGPYWTWNAQ